MPLQKNIKFVNKIILENAFSCAIIIIREILTLYIKEDKKWENLHFLGKAF